MKLASNHQTQRYKPQKRWLLEYRWDGRDYSSSIEARDFEEAQRLVAGHVTVLGELLEEIPG